MAKELSIAIQDRDGLFEASIPTLGITAVGRNGADAADKVRALARVLLKDWLQEMKGNVCEYTGSAWDMPNEDQQALDDYEREEIERRLTLQTEARQANHAKKQAIRLRLQEYANLPLPDGYVTIASLPAYGINPEGKVWSKVRKQPKKSTKGGWLVVSAKAYKLSQLVFDAFSGAAPPVQSEQTTPTKTKQQSTQRCADPFPDGFVQLPDHPYHAISIDGRVWSNASRYGREMQVKGGGVTIDSKRLVITTLLAQVYPIKEWSA